MKKSSRGFMGYATVLVVLILLALWLNGGMMQSASQRIEYSTLLEMIDNDQVAQVAIRDNELVGLLKDSSISASQFPDQRYDFETTIGDDFLLTVRQMQAAKEGKPLDEISVSDLNFTISYLAPVETPWWISFLPFIVTTLLFLGLWYLLMRSQSGGNSKVMNFGKSRARMSEPGRNKVTFADVAGADEEKEELQEMVDFLRNPKNYLAMGARIPKGVLLVGPPGTGKTLLAKAVAGEANVPFFSISGSDFVEMFVGVGASRVRDMFEQAKKAAPSIVFIDEIDAVGRHRGAGLGGGHDEREQTLNQLLVEMDGFTGKDNVIVIAATNRRDILDPALLRPGRFDRQIVVGYPDVKGREAILRVHTKKRPLAPDVDLATIAKSTVGFTGADLENLVNEASLLAARQNKRAITMQEIQEATIKVIAGPEKKSHKVSEKEKRLTAYHEAGHAVCTYYCDHQDKVHQVSIIPRGMAGGYTMSLPEQDKSFVSKTEMEENIVTLLGGRVAEQLVLDDISTGASNDLERATATARKMVTRYGFSKKLGPIVYGNDQNEVFLGKDLGSSRDYSDRVAGEIDDEVRNIVETAYQKATILLQAHMDQLHLLSKYLILHEKIERDDFEKLMQGKMEASAFEEQPTAPQQPESSSEEQNSPEQE